MQKFEVVKARKKTDREEKREQRKAKLTPHQQRPKPSIKEKHPQADHIQKFAVLAF